MREHQITFEALLKKIIQSEPLIDDHWGYKFRSHEENNEVVLTTVIDPDGKEMRFKSKYLIGCDGAGSAVRKSADIKSPRRTL